MTAASPRAEYEPELVGQAIVVALTLGFLAIGAFGAPAQSRRPSSSAETASRW